MTMTTDARVPLDLSSALALLGDLPRFHIVSEPRPGLLLGAEWDRDDLIALIREHGAEESGPIASGQGYGLAVWDGGRWLWVRTAGR